MPVLSRSCSVCTYDMQNVWKSYQRWFAFLRLYYLMCDTVVFS